MEINQINCDEEQIHLCGRIQNFGYLLVFDLHQKCVALSRNWEQLVQESSTCIGRSATEVFGALLKTHAVDLQAALQDLEKSIFYRHVEEIRIDRQLYYLSIYKYSERIFCEFELVNIIRPQLTKLYYYARNLDQSSKRLWKSLTENISQIIGYDRVMIYKFHEDQSGQVIAETINENLDPLLGYRYPEFDIPKQARQLYQTFLSRHTADVDADTIDIIGQDRVDLDLSRCSIRALSPIHLKYLKNSKVGASASFSILVDGELWGLVACQNFVPKHVDLAQRHLCVFLTQYAVNRYLSNQHELDLDYLQQIRTLENQLKEELLMDQDLVHVLNQAAPMLIKMVAADGLIIQQQKGIVQYGSTPDMSQFNSIKDFLHEGPHKQVVAYNAVKMPEELTTGVNFPGVAKIDIDHDDKLSIYWFRKEVLIEETWAGKPEKIVQYDPVLNLKYPSPRTSFEAWKNTVKGQAPKWRKKELLFMKRIRQVIQESIVKKAAEIQRLNERLIELNNTLDTYSYTLTHDLKNPLSSIKLSAQLISAKSDLNKELLHKLSTNILDAVDLMSSMMQKVFEFSKTNSYTFEYEIVDPASFITHIIDESKSQFNVKNLQLHLGDILTVYAEKTLLYQLFLNLISNAIKYSSKKELPTLEIYSYVTAQQTFYVIKDNGIGMDLAHREKIFEIFKRLPNASGFDGSGVGLSIVKRIVDKLKANITVDSILNEGTTFTLTFQNKPA